ncbi:MAG TPA: DNA replication/repair protein RecF [Anaeromyxobacteraceae bacterium]|nr:DNA replication/repair protein RecF [Anaeromyxobacteraceae bacterium]
MRLRSLQLQDFRNLAAVSLEPSERLTVLLGQNGQGKTNLLEAVYLLATLRPLRAGRLGELVRFGEPRAVVSGQVLGPGGERTLAVEVVQGGRTATLDGKPVDRLDSYLEGLAAVCFSPDDLLLVKGGPDGRRRFLDRAAFNRWPAVLSEAREYVRALRARNAALRGGAGPVEESFRGPLVRAGARILRRRRDVVVELEPRLAAAFAEISGPEAPPAELAYRPSGGIDLAGTEEELADRFASALADRLHRDVERGYTTCGPHMDDLLLAIGRRAAKVYGSQGQQRAFVLALRIAEIENLRAVLPRPPLLLLDDVSSELDPAKNGFLLDYVARLPAQAFLTSTDRRLIEPAAGPETRFFKVEGGAVSALIS